MLFPTFTFILGFLPVTVIVYFLLAKGHSFAARVWLIAMSLIFYSWFNWSYFFIIAGSIIGNHLFANMLYKKPSKWLLAAGIAANVALLGYFKYYDFMVENLNAALGTSWTLKHILLPLGISFFTFQQISFLQQVYERSLQKRYSFSNYCLFVCFFPQLIAGPIVLPDEMMSQFDAPENNTPKAENISAGLYTFALGMAKKILLADFFAEIADSGFAGAGGEFFASLRTVLAYMFQIYFDFSGYCDMAIGIGLMFNIVLPVNFLAPYRSGNIQEFWRTWHITLGRFLGQFVYRPLGGSRNGKVRTYLNLGITFLVSGLWHGANWMMILWGALHGAAIIIHRIWSKELKFQMPKCLGVSVTFIFVWLAWIFFRAENMAQALKVFRGFGDFSAEKFAAIREKLDTNSLIIMAVALGIIFFLPPANSFKDKFKPQLWHLVTALVLIVCSVFCFNRISPFIYFNF